METSYLSANWLRSPCGDGGLSGLLSINYSLQILILTTLKSNIFSFSMTFNICPSNCYCQITNILIITKKFSKLIVLRTSG